MRHWVSSALITGLSVAAIAHPLQAATEQTDPAALCARVEVIHFELEELRSYMRRPKDTRSGIRVTDAQPREVYSQAVAMFRKAERMRFEITHIRGREPNKGEMNLDNVLEVIDAAQAEIHATQRELGLAVSETTTRVVSSRSLDDLFSMIVQANRQLNLLLETQFAPSEPYQQITLAIAYSERLIEHFPDEDSTIPGPPEFEANKMPSDVYRKLLVNFALTREISEDSKVRSLKLEPLSEEEISEVAPSDVYDVATLLVSELAYLHSKLAEANPPREAYFPGRKYPSHVYQRAGILEKQLQQLARLVRSRPNWLDPSVRAGE